MFLAWKMIRILAELLSLVRTISEDIRDLRTDIRLLTSSPLAKEDQVKSLVLSIEDSKSAGSVSVLGQGGSRSITEAETLAHGEKGDRELEDIEEVGGEDKKNDNKVDEEELEEVGKRNILGETEDNGEAESEDEDQNVGEDEAEVEKYSETSITTPEAEPVSDERPEAASVVYQFGSTGASTSPAKPIGFSFKLPLIDLTDKSNLNSAVTVETPDLSNEEKAIDDKPTAQESGNGPLSIRTLYTKITNEC